MYKLKKIHVAPSLPERLQPLFEIAYNFWWTWNNEATALLMRIDPSLWEETRHNPIKMLGSLSQERLDELVMDESFLAHMDRVYDELKEYINRKSWYDSLSGKTKGPHYIAYFSAEYGLYECLPNYSGGLGVLAADHLKSASDMGLPLIGVGLLYRFGYFQQYLNQEGWQQENYIEQDFFNLPLTQVQRPDGTPVKGEIDFPGRKVRFHIWKLQVGRVPLYLLDTDIEENTIEDRNITGQLYGGDNEMRIQQEIVLGIGGIRALELLDIIPSVCHLNEGHSAFLGLERIRQEMQRKNISFNEALELVRACSVFTTHTPVPAGIDLFSTELMKKYFGSYVQDLGISMEELLSLGQEHLDPSSPFSMAVLAIRLAGRVNAVSKLHSAVSRNMWKGLWPDLSEEEVPISHVTNGVHLPTWQSEEVGRLYERYLGPQWRVAIEDNEMWERVDNIPDTELWRSQERLKERLIAFVRRQLRDQQENRRGLVPTLTVDVDEILDPEALTIGFARRFATYKRAKLILRNPERLAKILSDQEKPVQIIFAGKAHPRDVEGKEMIRDIIHMIKQPPFNRRMVFLENYDLEMARYLVQGVDLWLNTPRRPLEASGTSGMKVVPNGGLNLSVLDGWWCEGYNGENGWAIGGGEYYDDHELQDKIESNALYDILEEEIIPLFFDRGADNIPKGWTKMIKSSMKSICPFFNTHRMVQDYTLNFYFAAMLNLERFIEDDLKPLKEFSNWKANIKEKWPFVSISFVEGDEDIEQKVGTHFPLRVGVKLGELTPDDVVVEAIYGPISRDGLIKPIHKITLEYQGPEPPDMAIFSGVISWNSSGQMGVTARVRPEHPLMADPFELRLIKWWR